jgi:hypothetical protein
MRERHTDHEYMVPGACYNSRQLDTATAADKIRMSGRLGGVGTVLKRLWRNSLRRGRAARARRGMTPPRLASGEGVADEMPTM